MDIKNDDYMDLLISSYLNSQKPNDKSI